MTIAQIIEILGNRLRQLQAQRAVAFQLGDLSQVAAMDADIAQTSATLAALGTL
jgi:hypothetical protein